MNAGYSTSRVFVAASAGMAFFGVAMLSLGPILGQLNQLVGGATALPSTMSIGILVGTILFGPIVDKSGYKWLLILGSLFALGGLQGLSNFEQIGWLHAAIFLLGLGGGILNGLTNALVSDIYDDRHRGGRLSILGAFYCIGALLWTLLNYYIPDYHRPLDAVSVVMAGFILFFCVTSFPKAKPQEATSLARSLGLLRYPALLAFGLVLFFQSGFEGVSGSFTVTFLDRGGMASDGAKLSMTWFTVGMLVGRLPLGAIMARLKELGTLFTYLGVALVGVALIAFDSGSVAAVFTAMVLIGVGVGATFPVILNYVGGAFRSLSGTAFSIAIFIALLGQYAFNFVTGRLFEAGDESLFPVILAVAVLAMMLLTPGAVRLARRMERAGTAPRNTPFTN